MLLLLFFSYSFSVHFKRCIIAWAVFSLFFLFLCPWRLFVQTAQFLICHSIRQAISNKHISLSFSFSISFSRFRFVVTRIFMSHIRNAHSKRSNFLRRQRFKHKWMCFLFQLILIHFSLHTWTNFVSFASLYDIATFWCAHVTTNQPKYQIENKLKCQKKKRNNTA